jgi:hypothetical protein
VEVFAKHYELHYKKYKV